MEFLTSTPGFILLVVLVVIGGGLLRARIEAGRRKKLMEAAVRVGFSFDQRDEALERRLNSFSLFARFHGEVKNVLSKAVEGATFKVLEYVYRRGKRRQRRLYAIFEASDKRWPRFAVRTERSLEFGRDINFESNPGFSQRYYLRGDDEAEVRLLFTPELLAFLEQPEQSHWTIEAEGDLLAIQTPRYGRAEAERLPEFIHEAERMFRLFCAH